MEQGKGIDLMTRWIIKCWSIAASTWAPGGKWIPYTARQVMLRKAARLVCIAIPLGAAGPSAVPVLPPEMLPPAIPQSGWLYSPGEFIPPVSFSGIPLIGPGPVISEFTPEQPDVATQEPMTVVLLGSTLTTFLLLKKRT